MKLTHAYKLLATMTDLSKHDVVDFARFIRERGLIPTGRPGPGGGAPEASPRTLSNLVIGILASPSKRDAGLESLVYGNLLRRRCGPRMSRGPAFMHALMSVLADPKIAAKVEKVTVVRGKNRATIVYDDAGTTVVESFGKKDGSGFWLEAALHGGVVHQLASDLAEPADSDWTPTL